MNDEIKMLENNIIAAFIIDKDTHRYIKQVSEDMFINLNAKRLFKIIKYLYINKKEIDLISISNQLTTGLEKETNILQELVKITDDLVTTSNLESNIEKLKDINLRNQIKDIIIKAAKNLKDVNIDTLDIKKELLKNVESIKDTRNIKVADNIQDSFVKTLDEIEQKYQKGEDYSLYTGFFELDKLTDGLHENELTAIGARPGTGKTAFALNIATNIASKKKKKVYFCSLEMSSEQIMQRIIASYCYINTQFLRTGRLNNEDMAKIAEGTNKIVDLKLNIDTKTRSIEDLENVAYALKDKNEIDVLIIDYLTLLKSKEKFASRELEVAEISRKLKLLALDLHIPIIVLVQLNRDAENKVPTMANIRESGSIEQNCDNIMFLHNSAEEKKTVEPIDIILEKQRQGTTGKIQLIFNKKYSKFQNIVR